MNTQADPRRWVALAMLGTAFFMVILDGTIVYVALPRIEEALGFSAAGLQWDISAYLLSFGSLLLLGGRSTHLLGRRRLFMFGVSLLRGRRATRRVVEGDDRTRRSALRLRAGVMAASHCQLRAACVFTIPEINHQEVGSLLLHNAFEGRSHISRDRPGVIAGSDDRRRLIPSPQSFGNIVGKRCARTCD